MEVDPNLMKKKNPDQINHVMLKSKAEVMGKSVGCSSLMMKNFENNSKFLKLGMGRAKALGVGKCITYPTLTALNEESLNKFVNTTFQSSPRVPDLQMPLKEPQPDLNSYTSTPTGSRGPNKQLRVNSSGNVNYNSNSSTNRSSLSNSGRTPPKKVTNGQAPTSYPTNAQGFTSSVNSCPPIGKRQNDTQSKFNWNNAGKNHLGVPSTNRVLVPMVQQLSREGSDPSHFKNQFEMFGGSRETREEPQRLLRDNMDSRQTTIQDAPEERSLSLDGSELSDLSNNSASYYTTVFDNSDESLSLLKKMFINTPPETARGSFDETFHPTIDFDTFEWIPTEPVEGNVLSTKGEILQLFENNFEEECDGYLISNYYNAAQPDLDVKLRNLSSIHESLYTSSDLATLRTLEKFLLQLLQQKNYYGNLTTFGKLLAFINLTFLKKHITLLDALYNHPEMSVIREVLATNTQGQITKTLNASAGIGETKVSNEEAMNIFTQVLNKSNKEGGPTAAALANAMRNKYCTSGLRQNKQRLKILDSLSAMYKSGGEPHFPRYVCGGIDRNLVTGTETLSIPFEKSEKHAVHVQFERFEKDCSRMWPETTALPQNILEGTFVQVAPLKYASLMTWKPGMVVSLSAGQVMIKMPNEPKERMYLLRNFLPPNVPVVKLEKGYWRLLPRELDVTRDLYVGSCLSLLDLAEPDESVDVVVLNLYFGKEKSPIAPVKPPGDETNFQHRGPEEEEETNKEKAGSGEKNLAECQYNGYVSGFNVGSFSEDGAEYMLNHRHDPEAGTCSCSGHTLRVFEGKFTGIPERILVHCLHDKKEHVINVSNLKGFKLNYDIHAHFDGPSGNMPFPNSVWVIPRNISFLGDSLATKESHKPGYAWLFKPEYCLVMFPFSRNVDVLADLCRLIPFLHPELNYLALCAGLWSFRNKPEIRERERETVSYTRSQKAAIRDLTTSDVASEVCSDVVRSPFALLRRLYGCFPVISMWIALDSHNPDGDKEPTIPTNIKVPKPTNCEKCGGLVISKAGMVKVLANKYRQFLAKKMARRGKEGTPNQSMETLPQVDGEPSSRGGKDKDTDQSDKEDYNSDREPCWEKDFDRLSDKERDQSAREVNGSDKQGSMDSSDREHGFRCIYSQTSPQPNNVGSDLSPTREGEFKPKACDSDNEARLKKGMAELSRAMNNGEPMFSNMDKDPTQKRNTIPIHKALFSVEVEYDLAPVLCDLERTEDLVKRAQSLANSRWRVTKEFNASYLVDDEFAVLTTSPTSAAPTKANSEFLLQLAGVMNNIKKGKDMQFDPSLVFKLYQLSEECTSTTEGALLTGWSSYILSDQKPLMDDLHHSLIQATPRGPSPGAPPQMRKDKDCLFSNMCPLNFNCPRGTSCPCGSNVAGPCPLKITHSAGTASMTPPGKLNALKCPVRKAPADMSSNYSQLLENNPILTDISGLYKRRRDEDIRKLAVFNKIQKNNSAGTMFPKLGLKPDMAILKSLPKDKDRESVFVTDQFDFCKFTDDPRRKRFVASVKWDEDLEF